MKRLSKITILLLIFMTGCQSINAVRSQNRERLMNLSPGMTKNQVLSIMGVNNVWATKINNPYRTEFYRKNGHTFEVLLYYTDLKSLDGAITDDELTPIIILDGKLDGWGWTYWESLIQKYEIRIR